MGDSPAGVASETLSLKTVSPRVHIQPSPHVHCPISVLFTTYSPVLCPLCPTVTSVLIGPLSPSHFSRFVPSLPAKPFSAAGNMVFAKWKLDLASPQLKNLSCLSVSFKTQSKLQSVTEKPLITRSYLSLNFLARMALWACKLCVCTGPHAWCHGTPKCGDWSCLSPSCHFTFL